MEDQGEQNRSLLPVEAEAFCQSIKRFGIKDIGSASWSIQHDRIERLNIQAIINASAQENEFVKEFLINEDKFPDLVYELIATELWKKEVFGQLIKMNFEPKITFPVYMVLYHEATLVNLLETALFYQESCEACGDSILDLADYCHRKLIWLTIRQEEDDGKEDVLNAKVVTNQHLQELIEQRQTLEFDIAMKAISIIRYIADHLSVLCLSAGGRLLNIQDIPVVLVELLQNSPWSRRHADTGHLQKYLDSKWQDVEDSDRFKITKIEGQIWLTLFKLLMDPDCQRKYELSPHRKNSLLKLRSFLTEMTLDQLPVLSDLRVYLEHLSMMEPPQAKRDLILEQVPEIRESLISELRKEWHKIAKYQAAAFFSPSDADIRDQAKRWAETYNFDVIENLISEPPKCASCGELATKRCSRCQNEWYCRRECQVNAWKKHKSACDLLYDAQKKMEKQS